jgi:TrmH family RNA methyltransferase
MCHVALFMDEIIMNIDFNNIAVVLVETTHPGNIGAAARAMKTMGLQSLRLVKPKIFPSADATARAAGADDILVAAKVYERLTDALSDCVMVMGSSARLRNLSCPVVRPDEAAREMLDLASAGSKVAIIFGRESSGLSNEELDLCNKLIVIPTANKFSSLNLASAVQLICYELFRHAAVEKTFEDRTGTELATNAEMDQFYMHLEECLIEIKFLDPEKPRRLMRRLKQMFNRAALDKNEYNILRGILASVQESISQK